ncbi:AAA-domain-containing protein [Coemansia reversa NRRL 1564]|uniref:AAA-domain-containing protein n=1 Tax=Coemansia reversa (strain ATCC 12441 / NRRL 1564) TaxID=763665 RepID=A0A2G5BDC6_COERN|nr:AAA-domain-containing protein [Coemansia reversa NRRL 1564]|eukprot:PIA17018.1 AAA-domain-containing protein [Coemansia reversa NRRL 1564]
MPTSVKRCQALQHKLIIPPPRLQQREAIVKHAVSKLLLTEAEDPSTRVEGLARQVANATAGYVARDISNLCRQAVLRSLRGSPTGYAENDSKELMERLEKLVLHFEDSLQTTQPSQQLEFESIRPAKRWADVGGYESVKQVLQRFMRLATSETPLRLGIKPPSGILLYGPSGCGKTAMALAMIGESTCNVMNIRGSELFSKYLGETEARLRRLFQAARAAAPCIVFIDEVDSIAAKREWSSIESGGPALRVLSTLLNEMDGVHDTSGVAVVGCTNQLDKIDDAIVRPGRFDKLVEILLPSADDRTGILQVLAQKSPLSSDVDIDTLSKVTEGYSGAALEKLFREAGLAALRSSRDAATLSMDDFDTALARMHI